jgi:ubiquinol-cytochrome c reductase cytochrome b subunit
MNSLLHWIDDRTGVAGLCRHYLNTPVTASQSWSQFWGMLAIFNFLLLLITGVVLGTTFSPSTHTAWESVFFIQYMMPLGWFVRGIHHFASQSMVVILVIFVIQLIISRMYTAPREFSWWTTLLLCLMVFGLAHTGYLLPWDQRAYQATEIFTNIAGSTPVVGDQVRQVIQGGGTKGTQTITRLYAMHVMIFPVLIICLFVLHWCLCQYLGHKVARAESLQPANTVTPRIHFWPDQFTFNALGCLLLTCLLTGLTINHHGADLTGPADPSNPYTAARPEWYFLFLFRFLRTPIVEEFGLAFGAIHVPGIIVTLLFLMPFIGRFKIGHYFNITFVSLLLMGVIGLTTISLLEDSRSVEHQHAVATAKREADRAILLSMGPAGIPISGAGTLLRDDPLTQGPKIFAGRCSSCHHYNGHDGLGHEIKEEARAPDLGKFGSKEWLRGVLTDFDHVFAPMKDKSFHKEPYGNNILEGDMAGWSKDHREMLLKPEHKEKVDALIEFLYQQSGRNSGTTAEELAGKIAMGQEIFEVGELSDKDAFDLCCLDCHTITPLGSEKILKSSGQGLNLTGYASSDWLKSFIKNPAAKDHYGFDAGHNGMPGFEAQLTERELDLLVKWMLGDYLMEISPDVTPH